MTITSSHLAEARDRADLTQKELAAILDVAERTIVNWEREGGNGVPRKMEDRVRRYIGDALDQVEAAEQVAGQLKKLPLEALDEGGSTLARYSDVALLRELLRRAVQRRKLGEDNPDLGDGRNVIDFPPIDVSGLSDDDLAALDTAAGRDRTQPSESDT